MPLHVSNAIILILMKTNMAQWTWLEHSLNRIKSMNRDDGFQRRYNNLHNGQFHSLYCFNTHA